VHSSGLINRIARRTEQNWYGSALANFWLLPLWLIVVLVVHLRRFLFLRQQKDKTSGSQLPVLVVGNITVGGTGKTPLILLLIQRARALGLKPAVVSRGYGGSSDNWPLLVTADSDAAQCGDEPKLIQGRSSVPVLVDPQRARAVAAVDNEDCDIIFSDDGLQHYAMNRAGEIVVLDGERRFGNGWLLPVGPLREPVSRLNSVDLVLTNGNDFIVQATVLVNALTGEQLPVSTLQGQTVWAVSGIGNPGRFHTSLMSAGANVKPVNFPDHHEFNPQDFDFAQDSSCMVVMTEKDWVKCRSFARPDWWYLQVDAVAKPNIQDQLDALLMKLAGSSQVTGN